MLAEGGRTVLPARHELLGQAPMAPPELPDPISLAWEWGWQRLESAPPATPKHGGQSVRCEVRGNTLTSKRWRPALSWCSLTLEVPRGTEGAGGGSVEESCGESATRSQGPPRSDLRCWEAEDHPEASTEPAHPRSHPASTRLRSRVSRLSSLRCKELATPLQREALSSKDSTGTCIFHGPL